ncbi:hypothetical protein EI94DRAFT_1790267 [Lactarius quietus]|nr:hypothetical protein EI94DRAFT_1790267 [Lactarius quietus]
MVESENTWLAQWRSRQGLRSTFRTFKALIVFRIAPRSRVVCPPNLVPPHERAVKEPMDLEDDIDQHHMVLAASPKDHYMRCASLFSLGKALQKRFMYNELAHPHVEYEIASHWVAYACFGRHPSMAARSHSDRSCTTPEGPWGSLVAVPLECALPKSETRGLRSLTDRLWLGDAALAERLVIVYEELEAIAAPAGAREARQLYIPDVFGGTIEKACGPVITINHCRDHRNILIILLSTPRSTRNAYERDEAPPSPSHGSLLVSRNALARAAIRYRLPAVTYDKSPILAVGHHARRASSSPPPDCRIRNGLGMAASVVESATLWAMADTDGADLAETFYRRVIAEKEKLAMMVSLSSVHCGIYGVVLRLQDGTEAVDVHLEYGQMKLECCVATVTGLKRARRESSRNWGRS